MVGDWLKLHRRLLESAVFLHPDTFLLKVWVWCMCKARFTTTRVVRGQEIGPGQFMTGRSKAADELGVSPSKFYRALQKLAEMGNVSLQTNNSWTTITICNWSGYQQFDATAEQRVNNDRTTGEQREGIFHREELRREEAASPAGPDEKSKPKGASVIVPPTPSDLDTPEFHEAWSDWLAYRSARKLTRTLATLVAQLTKLARWGPDKAVKSIRRSIENGWAGLFDPPQERQANGRPPDPSADAARANGDRLRAEAEERRARTRQPRQPENPS